MGASVRRVPPFVALGVLPVCFTALAIVANASGPNFAIDFHASFWPAGRAVLHGLTPYAGPERAGEGVFVYPAPAALVVAVFALLPHGAADGLFLGITLLAVPLTLWVLGVRDWRIYGLVLLWNPVVIAWQTANVTTLLGLGVACAWRWRDRPAGAGLMVALVVSAKIFLWPLGLWLLATRRYAAAGWAVAAGLALNLAAWAVIGFDEVGRYLRLMRALTDALGKNAYSLATLGAAGEAMTAVIAIALAVAIFRVEERRGMVLSIALALVASPLIWSHYFALLIIPLALTYPRLHPAWALPVVMWVGVPGIGPDRWQLALVLVLAAVVVVACMGAGLLGRRTTKARRPREGSAGFVARALPAGATRRAPP